MEPRSSNFQGEERGLRWLPAPRPGASYVPSLTLLSLTCNRGGNTINSNISCFSNVHYGPGTVLDCGITAGSEAKCLFTRSLHSAGRRTGHRDKLVNMQCVRGWWVLRRKVKQSTGAERNGTGGGGELDREDLSDKVTFEQTSS